MDLSVDAVYLRRLDALDRTWQVWAELGAGLTEAQWSTATRCPGWDVAALFAHVSRFPLALSALSALPGNEPSGEPAGEPMSAVEILARFNAPEGVAHTMAATVADGAVSDAVQHTRAELVERFRGPARDAMDELRGAGPSVLVPWPGSGGVVTLVEALRIIVLESTVHLLDAQRALGHPPAVPASALQDTVSVLADLAPPVELIEAATGRSATSPWPVLR